MKMTNNISTFIKGLVIAFAITLFIPSASHATWGKHKYNNNKSYTTCKTHTNYKKLAEKFKKKYYKRYKHSYRKSYLYYTKLYNKYKYCKSCKSTGSNHCSKNKLLAAKYLSTYKKCHKSIYYKYYLFYIKKYNACNIKPTPKPTPTKAVGSVCGFVFEDTDCNGKYNKWCDKPLANVEVKVTDAEGNIQTVKTDKYGYYKAKNIAVGTASVDIVESSLPDNLDKNIEVGTDPTDVEVKANCEAWEERNGYCKVQVQTTGEVCGVVYHDADGNGQQNGSEIGIAGIEVVITSEDTSVQPYKVTTDNKGNFCKKDILAGAANVELNVLTLPTDHELTAGVNPNTVTVLAGGSVDAGKYGYTLIPTPLGSLSGVVDLDSQHLKDVTVTITDSNGDEYTVTTNDSGEYSVDNLPLGSTTVIIDTNTITYDSTAGILELDEGLTENTVEIEENENKVIYTKYTLVTP